eukprot:TRINITY_DN22876_c0_g1_i10.p2 TRINITY_DN22876_c0_g1~~TRINITY_DN22876_c0_g1_i10.p2  ORF type:complete len:102 (+),score=8.20 TRINITY_DN22876_c0_g1_i10:526-831(+)
MKQEEIPLQPHLLSTIKIFSNPRIPGTCSRINPTALPQDHHHRAPPLLENPNDATQIQNHTSKLPVTQRAIATQTEQIPILFEINPVQSQPTNAPLHHRRP